MRENPSLSGRTSGVLLHPSSLPGPHGIGDLGPAALRFVDWLGAAGQSWWQMLPVGPAGACDSPYDSPSAFAGSPLLVSLEALVEQGLLAQRDIEPPKGFSPLRVSFVRVAKFKERLLRRAFKAFKRTPDRRAFARFRVRSQDWLEDYALFMALREARPREGWGDWESPLRRRHPEALAKARREHADAVEFHAFVQWVFDRQWRQLRARAAERGVGLVGDLPMFVALESADVWAHQELFELNRKGQPAALAGVPPDAFSSTGQLWGNPLYRWDALRREGYDWWLRRLRAMLERFDAVRLDHFIGFERYWRVPAHHATAQGGRWMKGPGAGLMKAVMAELDRPRLIAEDLGALGPDVEKLRDAFELPGMRVLQFAFGSEDASPTYLPHNHPRRSVVYTGTHDNETVMGWYRARRHRSAGEHVRRYLGSARVDHWSFIRLALGSPANTAIVPVQDLLGLGAAARMNTPGTRRNNWSWRLGDGALDDRIGQRLLDLTDLYERQL